MYHVWLVPDEDHVWNYRTNKFKPHVNITKPLSFDDAEKVALFVYPVCVHVTLDEFKQDDLFAYFTVKCPNPPEWWPPHASVPFLYNYQGNARKALEDLKGTSAWLTTIVVNSYFHYNNHTHLLESHPLYMNHNPQL